MFFCCSTNFEIHGVCLGTIFQPQSIPHQFDSLGFFLGGGVGGSQTFPMLTPNFLNWSWSFFSPGCGRLPPIWPEENNIYNLFRSFLVVWSLGIWTKIVKKDYFNVWSTYATNMAWSTHVSRWTHKNSWNSLEFQAPNKNLERLILGSGAFSKSGSQNEDTESDGWDDDQSDQGHLAGERSWRYHPDSSQRFLLHVLGIKTRRREVMKERAFFVCVFLKQFHRKQNWRRFECQNQSHYRRHETIIFSVENHGLVICFGLVAVDVCWCGGGDTVDGSEIWRENHLGCIPKVCE